MFCKSQQGQEGLSLEVGEMMFQKTGILVENVFFLDPGRRHSLADGIWSMPLLPGSTAVCETAMLGGLSVVCPKLPTLLHSGPVTSSKFCLGQPHVLLYIQKNKNKRQLRYE